MDVARLILLGGFSRKLSRLRAEDALEGSTTPGEARLQESSLRFTDVNDSPEDRVSTGAHAVMESAFVEQMGAVTGKAGRPGITDFDTGARFFLRRGALWGKRTSLWGSPVFSPSSRG